MTGVSGKTYWLVGASEGLGRELAKNLSANGANLILSARNAARLQILCEGLTNARALPLDVTDQDAIGQALSGIAKLDGVIYNAGVYDPMPTANWSTDAALHMLDVNFAGAVRVLGETVPRFLSQGHGDITLIGSLAGYRGLPNAIGYGASKAALISLAETMRFDLKDSGVVVRIANPGFIKTRLTDKNDFDMPMLMSPERAAQHVFKAMQSKRFRTDFPRPFSWLIRAIDLLPDIVVYRGK